MVREQDEMERDHSVRRSEQEVDAAFKELHRKYGSDFRAFARDVQESLRKQRLEREERSRLCGAV